MAVFKCKMCGGTIEFEQGATVAVCDYCGTEQTISKSKDEVITNLFNRANNLRIKAEFDKAADIYEKILEEDNTDSEAHWGMVLCKYGIEYVEDPTSHKRIPTCHRAQYESIMADADYIAALENADALQQGIYTRQAVEISQIQKNILSIVKDEKPFDVFICYKETDANGQRTIDSALANDIYYQLTQEGLKVFYAAITLEDKLGQEYEPYIFAALNSARVMLVVGTKPEYFEAVWVRNEWSRFLKIMKNDRSKLLIPCYRDTDAYDLPEDFAHLQAQDMSKIGFVNDIVRGIKKVIDGSQPKAGIKETFVTNHSAKDVGVAPLLERAFMFLEDGKWKEADGYCERVLDKEPKNAEAYLCKLMADLKVKTKENLINVENPFDENNNFQKASKFSNSIAEYLAKCNEHIIERNEESRIKGIYDNAINEMDNENFSEAAKFFESIIGHEDSESRYKECTYKCANEYMNRKTVEDYELAVELFESIIDWEDSQTKIDECNAQMKKLKTDAENERSREEKYNRGISLIKEYESNHLRFNLIEAHECFASNEYYKDCAARKLSCEKMIEYHDNVIVKKDKKEATKNNIKNVKNSIASTSRKILVLLFFLFSLLLTLGVFASCGIVVRNSSIEDSVAAFAFLIALAFMLLAFSVHYYKKQKEILSVIYEKIPFWAFIAFAAINGVICLNFLCLLGKNDGNLFGNIYSAVLFAIVAILNIWISTKKKNKK